MSATSVGTDQYLLGHTSQEYERLRGQARVWRHATTTMLDQIAVAPGARCLDVGCGPGETMRLMAERVGPAGQVVGLDSDAGIGRSAVAALHAAGHRQCSFVEADVERTDAVLDGGFDLVFGRLILLHLSDPVAVLRRMWQWTAPGGHLIVQEYDMRGVDVDPPLPVMAEWRRVFLGTFTAVGRDIRLGHRLPGLFAEAGIGPPDGTEVAGRLDRLETSGAMLAATYRSIAPAALGLGIITEQQRDAWLADIARATTTYPDSVVLWPLLIGVHRERGRGAGR